MLQRGAGRECPAPAGAPPAGGSRVCSTWLPRGSLAEVESSFFIQPQAGSPSSLISHSPIPWGHPENCTTCPQAPSGRVSYAGALHSPAPPHWASRCPQKYVQDILQEQLAEPVYRALKEQGGHIYVCGDVTMAADVLKAIQRIMTQQGKLSVEDAGVFISRLRVSDGLDSWIPFPASRVLSPLPHPSCLDD